MNFELRHKLERVARRIRSLRLWSGLAICWLVWAVVALALSQLSAHADWLPVSWWWLPVLAVVSAIGWWFATVHSARDQRAVARRVETQHPELRTLLLVALEQASLPRDHTASYLQTAVIRDAIDHGRRQDWSNAVSARKLHIAKLAQFVALALFVAACTGLANSAGANSRLGSGPTSSSPGNREFKVSIDPGNTEIERGTSLLVVAQFAEAVPPDATLVVSTNSGMSESHDMVRSLNDPKFAGRVPSVENDLSYRVEFEGQKTETYQVKVFEYPELLRADAELVFPEYTSLASTVVEDVRQVTAVEGTKLTLSFKLNKEVSEARLVDADDHSLELTQDNNDPRLYRAAWTLAESRRLKLRLLDRDGRGNRLPAELVINVTPNRPPKITIEQPGRDVNVSPLEELQLRAKVVDDYGVVGQGVSYSLGGGESHDTTLTGNTPPTKETSVDHLIDMESLAAEPNQLLSYFVWAEDIGPDGLPRRTLSDMYFAEVRPFEEIYRQGEQPSERESQQREQGENDFTQAAGELADLQKEIINATWKLIRRETAATPSADFSEDSQLVKKSQQSAIDRASELAGKLEDAESRGHLDVARRHMQDAFQQLTSAADNLQIKSLPPALATEQAAYQALLKLRAREFQVVRGGRQQGGRAAGRNGRQQRQLNQLELKADENRYETQTRAASPEANQGPRESRDILNRLRELARRQDDLNDRLRELQSALQQAESPQRQAELQRELKRLREQQQEILRDTDELLGRMDRSEPRQQTPDAQQQVEEGRSHVQQASDALEQGRVPQALTEGTRASRQLGEARDQFRQQAANEFAQDMTELRRAARDLDAEQNRLSEQLGEQKSEAGRTLRDTGGRSEIQEGLAQQRQQLSQLLDRMQQTTEEAEQPEPLLARQLYDTVREAHQQKIDDALDVTQRLLGVGIEREASQAMQAADQGIDRLRQGVDRAAESVLGGETEALRRAQSEVEQLANELNREINADQENSSTDSSPRSRAVPDRGASQSQRTGGGPAAPEQNDTTQDGRQSTENASSANATQPGGNEGPSRQSGNEPRQQSLRGGDRASATGGLDQLFRGGGGGAGRPITGPDFRKWADRLRDVEEMLDDAELRSQAARIRGRAEDSRAEFKRHGQEPDWTKLHDLVAEPLNELGRRIADEIHRRESPDALVPIDRDPVPPEFSEQVRRYYERLGSGE